MKRPPAQSECVRRPYSAAPRIAAILAHLRTCHPVSFRWALCNAPSTRQPGNLSKLTRTYAGMVAEEAREVSRLGKAELVADVADARRLIEHRIDRLLHANDVQVDLRRHPDRGFEQSEEMRARQSCLLRKCIKDGAGPGFGPHRSSDAADAPITKAATHLSDRSRETSPWRKALDHRDHQVG